VQVLGGSTPNAVKDANGNAMAATFTSTFMTDAPAGPLTANAGPSQTGNEGSVFTFSGSASGGTGTLTYSWNFGDSSTASGTLTPTHTYTADGSYTVTLTVTDGTGQTSSSTTNATVNNVAPTVNPGGPYNGSTNSAISFTGSGSVPDTGDTLSYSWNFGDGTSSTLQDPTHTYSATGSYTVSLTVSDQEGASTTSSTTASISNVPVGTYNSNPTITTSYLTIPNFGAKPTIVSTKSGNWSDPTIWSAGRTPTTGDIVDIGSGTTVTYDVNSNVVLNTIAVQNGASLNFRPDINTQVIVGNFLVLDGGTLQVGTAANPVAAGLLANIVIANQAINTANDPNQFGTGLIVLGNVTMHGATTTPYVALAQEAHAGDTVLHLASAPTNWLVGQDLLLPDTRQITGDGATGYTYQSQIERVTIKSISADGLTVTLSAALKYDHLGAHDPNGVLNYLPQVMNDNRSIMVGSQSFTGTRGYSLFTNRANVDIEYAGFCEMGRTTNNPTGSGNVADRYAMTILDLFGPTAKQANGYQYTLIGNAVDNDGDNQPNNNNEQWGIAVNNSYYGLIQYNDVQSVAGAGIGVEDGSSSYNTFDHNFVLNVTGTSNRSDQQMQGDAYWFHNPNNYITNNIATDINGGSWDVYSYGYDIDASTGPQGGGVGTVTIAAYQGADPSIAGQSKQINMNDTPILQFSGNEIYGATQSGMTLWWIGTYGDTFYSDAQVSVIKNFLAWNFSTRGFYGYPTNNVTIDGMVARGDASQLNSQSNYTQGINFDDYLTRNLVIQNCNIQGMATGIEAPFMVGRVAQMDTTVIQNCFLDNTVNIDVTPPRSVNGSSGLSPQTLNIINDTFAHPPQAQSSWWYDISMSYVTSDSLGTSNMSIAQYVYVTNYNGIAGDNFQVFYSQSNSPTGTSPPNAMPMSLIDGLAT
jgi:hypothetical protein